MHKRCALKSMGRPLFAQEPTGDVSQLGVKGFEKSVLRFQADFEYPTSCCLLSNTGSGRLDRQMTFRHRNAWVFPWRLRFPTWRKMLTTRPRVFIGILSLLALQVAHAGSIQIADARAYVHADGALATQLNAASPGYFSTLGADKTGVFGWTFTNTTVAVLTSVSVFGFLDADIDRDLNTFFNEYGQLVSLALPASAPAGAIEATSWQIDEPGFVFGTILNDLSAGSLQNANFVSSATPDDVSFALGFVIGNLAPGQSVQIRLTVATVNIGGLQQIDPDSDSGFFLNGFATLGSQSSEVPEPACWMLSSAGLGALILLRKK